MSTRGRRAVLRPAGLGREDAIEAGDEQNMVTKSTRDDNENMRRMGWRQELVRHFRLLSVASFAAIATAAWEIGPLRNLPGPRRRRPPSSCPFRPLELR